MKKTATLVSLTVLLGLPFLAAQRSGPPRRIENPETIRLEGSARVEFHNFESPAVGHTMRYSVLIPPSYESEPGRSYPVVYFLHGMFNDDTSWCTDRYGSLPQKIVTLMSEGTIPEFLMVHPSGENSFYTDSANGGGRYEEYIRKDLIAEIESRFRTRNERRYRSIGGTSMGGYGALKMAIKYPELYASVLAGSPIVLLGDDPSSLWQQSTSRFAQFFSEIFGNAYGKPLDKDHWMDNSLENLAQTRKLDGIKVEMLYGTADRYAELVPMEQGIRTLESILRQRGVDTSLKIFEGEPHGWELIDRHLEETVKFLSQTF